MVQDGSPGIPSEGDSREGWTAPGRNCGACGVENCSQFMELVSKREKRVTDCPFYPRDSAVPRHAGCELQESDILGNPIDFILMPLPGEVSARKILLPFRPDLVERWEIAPGDILTGRPMGAGCPVPHVLQVLSASRISGVITCHVVGPAYSRGHEVKDLEAYHMIGFEGIGVPLLKEPEFGRRMRFLPRFCMMNLGHTGVVNMVLATGDGLRVRVEDILIS